MLILSVGHCIGCRAVATGLPGLTGGFPVDKPGLTGGLTGVAGLTGGLEDTPGLTAGLPGTGGLPVTGGFFAGGFTGGLEGSALDMSFFEASAYMFF